MSKFIYQISTTLGIFGIMIYTIIKPKVCIDGATAGLLLWFNKLLPSLLPFIILTNMLFQLGVVFKLEKYIGKISKLIFGVSGSSLLTFFLGSLGGYPTGAKLTNQLISDNYISKTEAQKTLCFSNNCGLLFIIATVGTLLLGDVKLGYFLAGVHLISAFTLLLISRFYVTDEVHNTTQTSRKVEQVSFISALTHSVQIGMDTIVYVGGYIIFFSVILYIVKDLVFFDMLINLFAQILNIEPVFLDSLLLGSLEFSNGTAYIAPIALTKLTYLGGLSAIIGFGGFCVFFQTAHILMDTDLSLGLYLFAKIIHAILAYSYTMLLYPIYISITQKIEVPMNESAGIAILIIFVGLSTLLHIVSNGVKLKNNLSTKNA
ncbi:MAG: hypothetical protein ATN36_07630 [Epulopiscium sp. Nele67-Bin005]|nr:MAG: hypothetical protein ATN36_07630 [Epulopiscium sp. Nele67-Bin005]